MGTQNKGEYLRNADRLRPSVSSTSRHNSEKAKANNHHSRLNSKAIIKAKEVVRKYKRRMQRLEFLRLKSIVPSLSNCQKVSHDQIIEESVVYIDDLHRRLLQQIKTQGIPQKLKDLSPGLASKVNCEQMDIGDLQFLIQKAVEPELQKKLQHYQQQDRQNLSVLLKEQVIQEDPHVVK